MQKLLLAALILLPSVSEATKKKRDKYIRKYGETIVHFQLRGPGDFESWGTGFFISPDGWIATNYHVMEPAFLRPLETKVTLILPDGSRKKSFTIGKCNITRSWLDLCVIKIKKYPKKWFRVSDYRPKQGVTVHSIWKKADDLEEDNPFSRSSGQVQSYDTRYGWLLMQSSAEITPGQSGAPIFNSKGKLAGVAAMILSSWNPLQRKSLRKVEKKFLGISAFELNKFISDIRDFYPMEEYLDRFPVERMMQKPNYPMTKKVN